MTTVMTEQEVEQAQRASGTLCDVCGGVDGIVKAIPVLLAGDLADPMNPEIPPDLFTCRPCRKLIVTQDWAGLQRRGTSNERSARMSDVSVDLNLHALGGAHHSGRFFPSIFLGVMPIWKGPPTFETQGEAVEVAEAKATLIFRRLFAAVVPFSEATTIDDNLSLEALAALEQIEDSADTLVESKEVLHDASQEI